MKKWLVIIVVVAVAAYCGYRLVKRKSGGTEKVNYRTVEISRQDITQEISATGKISPIKEVEVGTQVTGTIDVLKADYNSRVKEGDVIAMIDPRTYKAAYASACARLKSNEASLAKTRIQLELAEKELVRIQKLAEKKMVSESDYDNALAERDGLKATLQANEAAIEESTASVEQAETNLNYCTIASPVTGVVISRDVDEGQTVVSNMSASALFTIATDLSRIQVEASVPEADIGGIKVGQKVKFTVDAYKDTFIGVVTQIRLAAASNSNVVTYPVIVEAENPDEKLFPGMTANLTIIIQEASQVVSVPSAALRFTPDEGAVAPPPAAGKDGARPPMAEKGDASEVSVIWLLEDNGLVRPEMVKLGISDSVSQELVDSDSLIGKKAVIGKAKNDKDDDKSSGSNNPFAPKMPGRGNRAR